MCVYIFIYIYKVSSVYICTYIYIYIHTHTYFKPRKVSELIRSGLYFSFCRPNKWAGVGKRFTGDTAGTIDNN